MSSSWNNGSRTDMGLGLLVASLTESRSSSFSVTLQIGIDAFEEDDGSFSSHISCKKSHGST